MKAVPHPEPTVSIIIPTLNEAANIDLLLSALLQQIYKPYEILVVDGQSSDATAKIIKNHLNVRFLNTKRGVSIQRNTGAKAASGDFLFFIDADTNVPPTFIADCMQEIARRKLDIACPHYWPIGSTRFIKLIHLWYNCIFWCLQKLVPCGAGSCIIVRRKVFEKTKGFEQGYPFDDMKFLRVAHKHGRFGFIKPAIGVSDRRFRKEGVLKTVALYAVLSPVFLFNLHGLTRHIPYRFGHYDEY